ncbi:MAG TPA: hypothetical protein VMX54_11580 [Vicinamibacteria bacterium]|nr:hypothetical protein [Vicinamibacteria bacterium]
MERARLSHLLCASLLAAAPAAAQSLTTSSQKSGAVNFTGDALGRFEWTRQTSDEPFGGSGDQERWRVQVRPRLELNLKWFSAGVGAEGNYSKDQNDQPPPDAPLTVIRDNYRSRDVRLDLAWGRLDVGPVTAQGGRFLMPLPLTEMVWDADLRPQGGAVSLSLPHRDATTRVSLTGIYAKGSHVFEDDSVMYGGGAELRLTGQAGAYLQFAGSYLQFQDLDRLDPLLRRENTRVGALPAAEDFGQLAYDYHVVDLVGRLSTGQLALTADYCWNTALHSDNGGLWLAAVLGSTQTSRARLEYTYARIDRDAVVAAFNTDDFYWHTGLEAHRVDLGSGLGAGGGRSNSMHAIAQWQRFKDSPDPTMRDHWVTRYRIEFRAAF